MGPWAPSPEAGGQALILGFTWKMAEPTPLPRTRRWWAACPRAPRRRGSRFREGRGTARPCLSPAQPGLQPPCPSAGGSGRAAGGGRWGGVSGPLLLGALLSSLGASPHLALRAPSVLGCRWGGEEPQCSAPPLWLPCPLPTRPSTAPRVSSSGRAICFLLGLDEQPRRPRSGRCQPLSPLDSLAQAAWKPLPGGRREQSGWASGSGTPLGSPGTPRPPPTGRASGPALQGTQWARCSQW